MAKANGKTAPKKQQAAQAKANEKDTLIGVVLDRTGSMASCAAATIKGFNEFVQGQRKAQNGARTLMTLVQFDSPAGRQHDIDVNFIGVPIDSVPALNTESYQPRGGTPLHDAIMISVRKFEEWVGRREVGWEGARADRDGR